MQLLGIDVAWSVYLLVDTTVSPAKTSEHAVWDEDSGGLRGDLVYAQ